MSMIAAGWEADVQRGPDWLIVKVRADRFPAAGSVEMDGPELAAGIWDLMQRHFTYRLVLELDQIDVLSSYLSGELIRLYKQIREHDGVMRLCGLSSHNVKVLQTCRLAGRFQPYQDRKGAVMGACNRPIPR